MIEKPQGLDFSLRQKSRGIVHKGNNGYALTQKKAFEDIMKHLDIGGDDCFIDIGCGKGGCLYYASRYGFKRVAGIEIEDSLYRIAVQNFRKLKMPQIELFHADAVTFDKYNEFNVFYLFNPFAPQIYRLVLDRLLETLKNDAKHDGKKWLICYGASESEYIEKLGFFDLVSAYRDEARGTDVHIWKMKEIENN